MTYKNIFSLKNKTVVLTGAGGYLGSFFANALADFGADLALIDVEEKSLASIKNKINKLSSVKVKYYCCDISSKNKVSSTVKKIHNDFNKVDVLINNAQGSDIYKPFEECTLMDWKRTSSVNEEGLFLISQSIGKLMSKQISGGSIIMVSSIYGIRGPDQRIYENSSFKNKSMGSTAVYSYTKAGIIGLTKYLSTYWSKHSINVNVITPGGIESSQNDAFKKNYSQRVPLNRMGKPEELIGGIIFLSSDASSYITGQNLIIDGGLSAW